MAESEILTMVRNLQDRLDKAEDLNAKAHKEIYGRLEGHAVANARVEEKFTSIMASINRMEVKLEELNAHPRKRWDSIIHTAIASIIGGVISYFIFGKR